MTHTTHYLICVFSNHFSEGSSWTQSLGRRHKQLNLRDLFVAPSFDELDAVAVDSKGEPHRLNSKQLESIRERG